MGVYDSVVLVCPDCGEHHRVQTKAGKCRLETYTIDDAPFDVLAGVENTPVTCACGTEFTLVMKPTTVYLPTITLLSEIDFGEEEDE